MTLPAPPLDVLNLLMLEDNAVDAELISETLTRAGLSFNFMRVETEAAFRSILEEQPIDIILADYFLPTFDGVSAIQMARDVCPDIPCIDGCQVKVTRQ